MKYIVRDSKYAREKYALLIGAHVAKLLVFNDENSYLVKVLTFPKGAEKLQAFEKEHFMVHIDDLEEVEDIPFDTTTEEVEPTPAASRVLAPFVGQVIVIGDTYAERMGYVEHVQTEAVICEVRSSIVQVFLLASAESIEARTLDIHVEDVWDIPTAPPQPAYLMVHRREEVFYYTHDPKVANDCYKELCAQRKERDYRLMQVKDLATYIGEKGYLAKTIQQLQAQLIPSEQ